MEVANEREAMRHADGSDEELSATFREWAQAMSREQVRHLLAKCSGEHMIEHLRKKQMPLPPDPHRTWRLLKAELVSRLQALTALQKKENLAEKITLLQEVPDDVLIMRLRRLASEMTREQVTHALAGGSAEGLRAYLQGKGLPLPDDPGKLWHLF